MLSVRVSKQYLGKNQAHFSLDKTADYAVKKKVLHMFGKKF